MRKSILKCYVGLVLNLLTFFSLSAFAIQDFDSVLVEQWLKVGGSASADADAALEINSITKGLLISRMTEAQRDAIATPPTGLLVYNTDDDQFNYYDGSSWEPVGGTIAPLTASRAVVTDGSGVLTAATTTATEIGYVNGVTSAIQTQLDLKAPLASPTFSGTITTPLTASRALTTGASSELAASAVTATELGFVGGVTSTLCGINQSCTQTNKTFTSPVLTTPSTDVITLDDQASTPANPSAGNYKVYAKTDGNVYKLNSSGVETQLGGAGGSSGINVLAAYNPNAESGTTYWSETGGGTFTTTSTAADVGNGVLSFSFDASASNDYAISTAATVPAGLYGQNCLADFIYKGFDSTVLAQVYDGSSVVAAQLLSAASTYTRVQINFICPSSGTIALRFLAGSDAAIGYWDEVHLGSATNIGTSMIMSADKAYTPVFTGYGTVTNIDFKYQLIGDKLILIGKFTAGTTTATEARISLPENLVPNVGSIRSVGHYAYNQNTATSFHVLAEPSNSYVTAGLQDSGHSGLTKYNGNLFTTGSVISVWAIIPVTNASTATTVTNVTSALSWQGYHDNDCSWARTNTALGDPTADSSCTFTEVFNRNFGSVTSALSGSDKLPGIVFSPPRAGSIWICANTRIVNATDAPTVAMFDGATQLTDGISNTASGDNLTLCSLITAVDTTAKTIKLQSRAASAASTITKATPGRSVTWNMYYVDQTFPSPAYTGSLTTNASSAYRIESVKVSYSGGLPVLSLESGDWLNNTSDDNAAGDFTLNIHAGIFSATPVCVCTGDSTTALICAIDSTTAPSAIDQRFQLATNAGTGTDGNATIVCMGPR